MSTTITRRKNANGLSRASRLSLLALAFSLVFLRTIEAAAPTFVTHAATVFNTVTTPKSAAGVAVLTGDILVAFVISADSATVGSTPTNDGAALTWTPQQINATASNVWQGLWTATADSNRTIVVTFATTGGNLQFGGDVLVWRSATLGATTKVTSGSGAPTLNITTQQANSAIVVAIGDWAAVTGAPTWRTNAGAFTSTVELAGDGVTYSARGGYHADAGAIATYAVGVTAPVGETYSIVTLELKGPTGGAVPNRSLLGVGTD